MGFGNSLLVGVLATAVLGGGDLAHARDGVWLTNVSSTVYDHRATIGRALDRLVDLGVDGAYPGVWNKGYAFWQSDVVRRTFGDEYVSAYGQRDVLGEFVAEGRRRGLRVVPWFEYGLKVPLAYVAAGGERTETAFGAECRRRGWLTTDVHGNDAMAPEWGVEKGFLNPVHPEVRRFLADCFRELAAYDVDGVQVDDHFSLHHTFGYDDRMRRAFADAQAAGSTLDWNEWRRLVVADLIAEVGRVVRPKRFSISPGGDGEWSQSVWLQDWPLLARRKDVDEVIVQVYRPSLSSFEAVLNHPSVRQAATEVPLAVGILTGLRNNSTVTGRLIRYQTAEALRRRHGVAFFYYDTLDVPAAGAESERQRRLNMALVAAMLRRAVDAPEE